MKKIFALLLITLLLATPALALDTETLKAGLLVEQGIEHIENVGPEAAAQDFMNNPEFKQGSHYLLFYKYDGTCLALGAKPEIAGRNRWDVKDPDGVYQIREMVKAAINGGGFVEYKYINPKTGKVQNKKTWVKPVPGMPAFVGCGIYY